MTALLLCGIMTQVLIVEPDAPARARLRSILESNGFTVAEPSSASLSSHALESMDVTAYSCVVASVEGCGAGGIDVLSLCPAVPVILVTDDPDVRRAVKAMRRGACDYLVKPFDPDELVAAIE